MYWNRGTPHKQLVHFSVKIVKYVGKYVHERENNI